MRLLVVNNLSSGLGDGQVFDFARAFSEDGDEVVVRSTNGTTDLRTFLYDADRFDAVVAAGGDGTISTVAKMLADTAIPLLPFPAGTGNLLVENLALPTEIHALTKLVREGRTMDFDMGEIELDNGKKFGFTIMAGAGYDATIMKEAEPGKKLLGPMAYFTSAVANATPQFSKLKLTIDDKTIETSGVGVLVINFSKIQFDISFVHENLPRDGMFDIVVLNTKDAWGLVPALFAAFLDRDGGFPNRTDALELFRGSTVRVEADPPLKIQYDGEATNNLTPFTATLLPDAIRFIVSSETEKLYLSGTDSSASD